MIEMRYCTRCQFEKPAEGFVCLSRGRFGRTKVWMCADCHRRQKNLGNQAQRDAYGREMRLKEKSDFSTKKKLEHEFKRKEKQNEHQL